MKKLEKLRKEALESCQFRGHKMRLFNRLYRHWWDSECKICKMGVIIRDDQQPNGIEIYGEAVAVDCSK